MMLSMDLNHRRTTSLLFAFACVAWLLASCAQVPPAPTSTPQPPTPTVSPDWQSRWLQNIPCAAPCWEGIMPGQTTADQVMEILNRNPLVTNMRREPISDYGSEYGSIVWSRAPGGASGSALYYSARPQIIVDVVVGFRATFSLREIMAAYGQPSHVFATARQRVPDRSDLCQAVTLVYLSHGLEVYDTCTSKVSLDQDMTFGGVVFFIPSREALDMVDRDVKRSPDWLLPWEGFKGFQYYCRDGVNGKLCRGEQPPP